MINEIKKILNEIPNNLKMQGIGDKETHWTHEIKKQFSIIGENKGYYVCTSKGNDIEIHCGEWIYDQCWLKYSEEKTEDFNYEYLLDVFLVLESEWGNAGDVIDDFHKILQAKARYKVMIFQENNPEKLYNYMTKNIEKYNYAGEKEIYILACYKSNESKFEVKILE